MEALEKWSSDEFRSVNGQIEWILNTALKKAGRLPRLREVDTLLVDKTGTLTEGKPKVVGVESSGRHPGESLRFTHIFIAGFIYTL